MFNLKRCGALMRDEKGITALETAIILIAFVVVASVFAFTMLSAGTFSTEQGRQAVYAGLAEVQGSMKLNGSVVSKGEDGGVLATGNVVTYVVFTVDNVAGGEPIDMAEPDDTGDDGVADANSDNRVVIDYIDQYSRVSDLAWTADAVKDANSNGLLDPGDLFEITVPISLALDTSGTTGHKYLGANTNFAIEIKPAQGAVLRVQRGTPAYIGTYDDLK